jgi:hypothetical protein
VGKPIYRTVSHVRCGVDEFEAEFGNFLTKCVYFQIYFHKLTCVFRALSKEIIALYCFSQEF